MSSVREAFSRAFSGPSVRRSLIAAVPVGTAVNLINQGDLLLAG